MIRYSMQSMTFIKETVAIFEYFIYIIATATISKQFTTCCTQCNKSRRELLLVTHHYIAER